jgi:pimeloyl-ACP methyl ester carboxylesterase
MKERYLFAFLLCAAMTLLGACEKPTPPPAAPTTGFATSVDGVPIKYESAGNAEVALVFVHCWTCNLGFWDAQVEYFADRYQIVRLDLAGHGESGQGRKTYTMPAFGADVGAVVNKLGLKKIVLIGHSMGGPVAMEAEKPLGDRVIGVVGVDAFYTGFETLTGSQLSEFVKPFEENFAATTDEFVRSMFAPTADPVLVDRTAKAFASGNKDVAISAMKEVFAWYERTAQNAFKRVGAKLRNINANPKGENKPLHKSVVLISGAGHFVAQEKPAEFNRTLEEIVNQFVRTNR